MTENKAQKKAIRKRMAATGEPYNTARRNVLAQHQTSASFTPGESGAALTHRVVKSPYAGAWARFDTAKLLGGARFDAV
ncbi:hypothetical protein ACIRRI_18105, partial [Streptomyces mirabilis]